MAATGPIKRRASRSVGGFALNRRARLGLFVTLVLLASSGAHPVMATRLDPVPATPLGPVLRPLPLAEPADANHYPARRIIVRFRPGTPVAERRRLRVSLSARRVEVLATPPVEILTLARGATAADMRHLRSEPSVVYAEPDVPLSPAVLPNDPFFGQQWWLHNVGQDVLGAPATPDADIDAPEAWDVTTGSRSILVGSLDSGIDYTHPELASNVWMNPPEAAGAPGVDDDGNGLVDDVRGWDWVSNDNDPADIGSHGTAGAGIIGAVGNNGAGIAGINWQVSLMALRVLDAEGRAFASNVIKGISYARSKGARVVNLSFGTSSNLTSLRDALAAAPDVLFVVSAGNAGIDVDASPVYPCSYPLDNVICVAASDQHDNLAAFSNYGSTSVDLAAPGQALLTTSPGNDYAYRSGTSVAAPVVTGGAALVLSKAPSLTVAGLRDAVLGGVDQKPSLTGKTVTGGRLNLYRALHRAAPAEVPAEPSPQPVPATTTPGASPPPSPTASPSPSPQPTIVESPSPSSPASTPAVTSDPTTPAPTTAAPEASSIPSETPPSDSGPVERSVTLEAARAVVRHGTTVSLSGRLVAADPAAGCTAGIRVSILRSIVGDEQLSPFLEVVTDASGAFETSVYAARSSTYVARVEPESACGAASSEAAVLLVRPKLSLGTGKRVVPAGEAAVLRTRLVPCEGHEGTRVVLVGRRRGKDVVQRSRLDDRCRQRFTAAVTKKTVFRARWPKQHADHEAARSRRLILRPGS